MSRLQPRAIARARRLDLRIRPTLGLILCVLSLACSGGGCGEQAQEGAEALEAAPQNEWDVMDWDEGEWAVVLPATRLSAAV